MTPQELKNSILQLAIQGKLVEQRPEEGTGEELFRQIQAEKQRLIKAGTIKREKPLPEISDDEKPFNIPESWKWVRISQLGDVIGGGTPKTENSEYWDDAGIPWLTPADMKHIHGKYVQRGERNISSAGLEGSSARIMPTGSILYSSRAPIGYIAIAENSISTNQGFKSLVPVIIDINLFIYYCLIARTDDIIRRASGTTFKEISGADFGLTIVPLPPLAEQKRIVAKIEELLPYIDRYEEAWRELEDFNKRFPVDMQKAILQFAIQGKLVEQRPEEGTGEELSRQIQAEKQRLIKAGTIKREKPLPEIAEDEKPFDIPESWKWVKLSTICSKITDGEHLTPKRTLEFCGYYLLSARNVRDGHILLEDVDYVDQTVYKLISSRCNPQRGDLLISCSGSVGRCALVSDDNKYVMVRSAAMASPILIDNKFLMYCIQSAVVQTQIKSKTKQTAQANLFQDAIRNIIIPLPPIAEQKRIVAKLEEILPLCEKLK